MCFASFSFEKFLPLHIFCVALSFSYGYHPLLFVHGQNFLPSGSEKESASFCLPLNPQPLALSHEP